MKMFTVNFRGYAIVMILGMVTPASTAMSQTVLFDFDAAPLYATLPIDQNAAGITAHLSATGLGYSIQEANVLGFTPAGFAGRILYPNSGNLTDLFVRFDQTLTDFSIMYSCNELGCDDAATMRVTALMNGSLVGTNTRTTSHPGTWPADTLSCSFPQGFDSVVVHYDSPPPTCKDWGPNYMADNMRVTPLTPTRVTDPYRRMPVKFVLENAYPAPFNPTTTIRYSLPENSRVVMRIYNLLGNLVQTLKDGIEESGYKRIEWNASGLPSGVYFYRLDAIAASDPSKLFIGVKKVQFIK